MSNNLHIQSKCGTVTWEKMYLMFGVSFAVAGALHHPTTVDTGLAHGLAPTAHVSVKRNAYNIKACLTSSIVSSWG